jgi:hypothetical protein
MSRQRNLIWGLIPLVVGGVLLFDALDLLPNGLSDFLWRAWPVIIIITGLIWLLRGRIPLGSVAAIGLAGLTVAGVAVAAYTSREGQIRTENVIEIEQTIDDAVTLLVINVDLLDTDLTITRGDSREITGEFVGSEESVVEPVYIDDSGATVEYFIEENKPGQFPMLEAIGRGTLDLNVPTDVNVAVNVIVADGLVTLNLSDLQLERLTLTLDQGDAAVTLPAYQPRSLDPAERPGEIIIRDGDLIMIVPDSVDARLAFDRQNSGIPVVYDPAYIDQRDNVDGILRREIESSEIRLYYDILISSGILTLEVNRE